MDRLYRLLYKILNKLYQLNRKLDYARSLASTRIIYTSTASFSSSISGVTSQELTASMVGNFLYVYLNLNLTSTAYNNIGTGMFSTAKVVGTVTIPDCIASSISTNNDTNRSKIYNTTPTGNAAIITFGSAYSSGNAQPISMYFTPEISGTNLVLTLRVKAVKTVSSSWVIRTHIPVVRVPGYNGTDIV